MTKILPLRTRSVVIAVSALLLVYLLFLLPWFMNWGATPVEREAALPGDDLLADPNHFFTRAITIHAPPSAVWPWIVQIGQDRAGFYSNTWLENLTGADIHNANVIRPEWQTRRVGDSVPLFRKGVLPFARTQVEFLKEGQAIANIPGRFVLEPVGPTTTRLIVRESISPPGLRRFLLSLTWDPAHFVMQARMLRGIKERVEAEPLVPAFLTWVARLGWMLCAAFLFGLFVSRPSLRIYVLIPLLPVLFVLRYTGDGDAAIASFLAVGLAVYGAVRFGRAWWAWYVLLTAVVALVLLIAPDPYTALGLLFLPASGFLIPKSAESVQSHP